ncbi:hypothetical protein K457DRAFT_896084 [Linnemannia elongata AG-77]|uniref:Uncharacterized protein n=1 Tax=Linnemannia elongata AG-77 TaxID=1314771 RepID=A0A197JVT1_9FUNG|nr:hypothetical protein K457DRAFT_896084 [Linnemannia elongata AG-77]
MLYIPLLLLYSTVIFASFFSFSLYIARWEHLRDSDKTGNKRAYKQSNNCSKMQTTRSIQEKSVENNKMDAGSLHDSPYACRRIGLTLCIADDNPDRYFLTLRPTLIPLFLLLLSVMSQKKKKTRPSMLPWA